MVLSWRTNSNSTTDSAGPGSRMPAYSRGKLLRHRETLSVRSMGWPSPPAARRLPEIKDNDQKYKFVGSMTELLAILRDLRMEDAEGSEPEVPNGSLLLSFQPQCSRFRGQCHPGASLASGLTRSRERLRVLRGTLVPRPLRGLHRGRRRLLLYRISLYLNLESETFVLPLLLDVKYVTIMLGVKHRPQV